MEIFEDALERVRLRYLVAVGRWPTHHSIKDCAPFIAALSR
jgi:hypothetical protein